MRNERKAAEKRKTEKILGPGTGDPGPRFSLFSLTCFTTSKQRNGKIGVERGERRKLL